MSLSRHLGVFGWGDEEWLGTGRNRSFIRAHHTRLYQEEIQSFLGWGIVRSLVHNSYRIARCYR